MFTTRGNVYHKRECLPERGCLPPEGITPLVVNIECLPQEGILLQHMVEIIQYLVRVHLHHSDSYHRDAGGKGWPVLQKWIRKIRTRKKNRTGHREG